MTASTEDTEIYSEPGAGAAPLLWGPGFAVVGYLMEVSTGGPVHTIGWVVIGVVLFGLSAMWVYSRRKFMSLRVTGTQLVQGSETLEVARISDVTDVDAPVGARVLGGGFTPPRKYQQVPLRLDDGSVVLAWARDGERLRTALEQARQS